MMRVFSRVSFSLLIAYSENFSPGFRITLSLEPTSDVGLDLLVSYSVIDN